MSRETVGRLGTRLNEHSRAISEGALAVVAHGGEPLLYPDLDFFFEEIRRAVQSCEVEFAIQTNGTLLNTENLAVLERHDVRIGVSVDGSRETHNRFRVTHRGEGSYDQVVKGLELARERVPHLMQCVLQVIDTSVPPVEVLDTLESYGVDRADLLFPDLHHDTILTSGIRQGAIGRWLIQVFNEWASREKTVNLRVFSTIIRLLLGARFGTDQFGADAPGALIIETDGSYQIYDALKTTFIGAGHTGMTLADSAVGLVEALPLAQAFRDKASTAAGECLQCHLFSVCGGGSPLHRYSARHGFNRRSVYCSDLMMLIEHIGISLRTIRPDLKLAIRPS